jgi:hypothetical protein
MIWQDVAIMGAQWIFVWALVPALQARSKPPLITSLFTSIGLVLMGVAFITPPLTLYLSSVACFAAATCWFLLFKQRLSQIRGQRP